jgi:hypothetical protein
MRNLLFSVFAIAVAGVAAMMSTTAMLNSRQRVSQETLDVIQMQSQAPASTPDAPPATPPAGAPATPGGTPDTRAAQAPAAGSAPPATETGEPEADEDPYEGIAAEELPPDLQYNADSSVSFPTNI